MECGQGSNQFHQLSINNRGSNSGLVIGEHENAGNNMVNNFNLNNAAIANNNMIMPMPNYNLPDPCFMVPIANIVRIMRRILPVHAKISDDAKEVIQECVSHYVNFITSEANERCHREHRKTVAAEDVIFAHANLGFDNYVGPLTLFLDRYRHNEAFRNTSLHFGPNPSAFRRRTFFPDVQRGGLRAPPPVPAAFQVVDQRGTVFNPATVDEYNYFRNARLVSSLGSGGGVGGSTTSSSNAAIGGPPPPRGFYPHGHH
ncbi:hypothetical protein ACH5RR_027764 [Cinchona calisaya]|uniref:Transcription factor CBF/NF-Y/archaeal histone domain-containing protein n=1 Tax=Cinchona calisaya TaxID=153742 RepID=A0ABD2YLW0_9GENT